MSGLIINPFAHGGGGGVPYWGNVRAQLHFDGDDEGTDIIDTGPLANVFAAAGSGALSADTEIFGPTVFAPGSAGSADAASTHFHIGNNPFTIRFWVRKTAGAWTTGEKVVCGAWGGSQLSYLITINALGQPTFYYNGIFPFCPQALPNDTVPHMVSISRLADYSMHCHIDGVRYAMSGSLPGAGAIPNPTTQPFRVGSSGGAGTFDGAAWGARYLDELEIIIGQSLYTAADYTPSGPFPTP